VTFNPNESSSSYAGSMQLKAVVPEPLTLSLFGAGLAGVGGLAGLRRGKKAKA
jgi:hypothetical protein